MSIAKKVENSTTYEKKEEVCFFETEMCTSMKRSGERGIPNFYLIIVVESNIKIQNGVYKKGYLSRQKIEINRDTFVKNLEIFIQ